ncbi:sugar kinase [Roseivivax isoporae]|uniref:2-dehydro-3-deoxygluconokinase n=1 Tax=Roseivivax isoporae LMG 25204 TaxID=1449351 RepID=X7F924_9RHOB|nr:sugar kinase [Roseivivax isoporae]ETX29315.1 2-dehydro-3-deoxygluconokinase [Roseivivax isoporae LMG 25204]
MAGSFLALGECMVELAEAGDGLYRRGFAGDTFNTAWYARRLLPDDWTVSYGSVIGTDRVSGEMADFMDAEGIDTSTLRRDPERTVGLYMIAVADGERSFSYWRGQSAARRLADDAGWLSEVLAGQAMVHVSGITMAILPPEGRLTLCAALARARAAGTTVSFDTNLRPRLWESSEAMRDGLTRAAGTADIVLPSFDEDSVLFGDAVPDDTIARYRALGARCVAVKDGAGALTLWSEETGRATLMPERVTPVDTTAAGDSFAAGFLTGLATGAAPEAAARGGIALAARVIAAPGALVRGAVA